MLGVQFLLDEGNGLVAPRYHRCCTTGDQHCFRRAGVPKQDYFLIFFDSFTWCPLGGTFAFLSFLSDHHAQSETQAGKRTTGLTTVLQHGPGVCVTRRHMYNCFPLWCVFCHRPTRLELVLICFKKSMMLSTRKAKSISKHSPV